MEHARNVCKNLHGIEAELVLYEQYKLDLDEYIHAACSTKKRGLLCKACKRNTCAIIMLQTRSADEGMTAYLSCSACSHRARIG